MIEFSRRDFIQHLNNVAGDYAIKSISTTWHDVDEMEAEFTEEEGFTVVIEKGKFKYKKDFLGQDAVLSIPANLLESNPELTLEEYNAQRIIQEMEIK